MRAWWIICSLLAVAFFSHGLTVVLFGLMSFWALREFITLTPTRLGDHRALFWVFFFFTPLQYVLVWLDKYELYSILIPVYAFLFIPARIALSGDYKRFLERVAKIQSGLLICVYCLSFAPALLYLPTFRAKRDRGNARLLFFFVTMALFSEALQFVWSQLYGQHVIAPSINAARTWEGLVGGTASTALAGMVLYWATPFDDVWQAALHVDGHRRDGLRRRDDDVGHQARPRRPRLRHAGRRPRRRARPHRRDLLRRAGVLPRHAAALRRSASSPASGRRAIYRRNSVATVSEAS